MPSFGFSGGGTLNVSMKSGTNEYHGTGYYFGRNPKLNALANRVDRFSQSHPQPHLGRHGWRADPQKQAVLLWQLRAMEDYPAHRYRGHTANRCGKRRATSRARLLRQATSDLSTIPSPPSSTRRRKPFTRTPFPGNIIPHDRIDPHGGRPSLTTCGRRTMPVTIPAE